MKFRLLLIASIFTFIACNTSKKLTNNDNVLALKKMMTGSFNSAEQAKNDSSYYDITLHMYPIWNSRPGHWLYVEQSVTANQAKPYRQRVYRLEKLDDNSFASHVYLLPDPKKVIGGWKNLASFESLKETDLELKDGCAVILKKQTDGTYKGSTGDKTCPSSLRGANYANSIVTVKKGQIESWVQFLRTQYLGQSEINF